MNFGAIFFKITDNPMTFKPQLRMKKSCDMVHVQLNKHLTKNMFGVPYPVFTRTPLVGSLDMDYWCSAFGTKCARVNTGYGTPNMF